MRTLKTGEAAALLNVTPNTLRTWERRFGYPNPQRGEGRHRLYAYAEIAALRDTLESGLTISSAVQVVSGAYGAEAHAVLAALTSFSADHADEAMEDSLALRSLERSVEEVLLPVLNEIRRRKQTTSAAWGFAATWGNDWLRRAHRMAPEGGHDFRVLIGDATDGELEPAAAYIQALALCCVRRGMSVLVLPVSAFRRLGEATSVFEPHAAVVAGCNAGDELAARWAECVRGTMPHIALLLYHRGLDPSVVGSRARILPPQPIAAQRAIEHLLDEQIGRNGRLGALAT